MKKLFIAVICMMCIWYLIPKREHYCKIIKVDGNLAWYVNDNDTIKILNISDRQPRVGDSILIK